MSLAAPPVATASPSTPFLIDSATGPVIYSPCAGPLTWSLELPAAWPDLDRIREATAWQEAFAEVAALTDYTFEQVAHEPPGAATIAIDYREGPQSAAGPLGSAGITEFAWDGSRWIASRSTITVESVAVRRWERSLGSADIHAWVIRHELAHALGLGHSDDLAHLMAREFVPRVSPTTFRPDDFVALDSTLSATCPA